MSGWIKLHRQIVEWEWFDEPNTFRLFLYCLLKANHQDKNYRGELIKRGSFVTSLESLSKGTKLSVRNVRTSLTRLESTHELTSKRTRKGTVIQVVNYDNYQEATHEPTRKRQESDKKVTTTKNEKNEKNSNIPSFDEFKQYALEKKSNIDLNNLKLKYDSWLENDWCITRKGKQVEIRNWKTTLLNTLPYIKETESLNIDSHTDYIKQQIARYGNNSQG